MDIKLTKAKLKSFWEYGKLRLIITVAVSVLAFYLLFTITRPVVNRSRRFDIIHGGAYIETGIERWSQDLLSGVLTENQKQVNIENLSLADYDGYNAQMVITTRMVAQEGDLFIIPYNLYTALAGSNNLAPLDEPIPGDPEGRSVLDRLNFPDMIDPEVCRVTVKDTDEDGNVISERKICGINATYLYGLMEIGIVPSDYVICVPDYKDTDYENIIRALQWILDEKTTYHDYTSGENQ